uniref:Uncharacterized protein n=1 Tax=Octopus bimaculoides TaxID=37653 RepID=A0A0L8GR66_OCTBM
MYCINASALCIDSNLFLISVACLSLRIGRIWWRKKLTVMKKKLTVMKKKSTVMKKKLRSP